MVTRGGRLVSYQRDDNRVSRTLAVGRCPPNDERMSVTAAATGYKVSAPT